MRAKRPYHVIHSVASLNVNPSGTNSYASLGDSDALVEEFT